MDEIKHISKRLQLIASFIPEGAYFADIGSDHAYLPTYFCLHDEQARAIAGEVNEGPFNRAKAVVESYRLTDVIDVRLGNGLNVLHNEQIDCVIIAGMGGSLMTSILEDGKHKLKNVNRLILQPNIDEYSVRKWLLENNYKLIKEHIICENTHFYEILVAVLDDNEENVYDKAKIEKQLLFGPFLLNEKSTPFIKKWESQYKKINWTINEMNKAREPNINKINSFKRQLTWIKEVLKQNGN